MQRRHTRMSRIGVLVAVLALVAAACAGDGDDATPGDGAGVTIGMIMPITGDLAELVPFIQNGFELAIDQVNAAGHPCGTINLKIADSELSADVAKREGDAMIAGTDDLVAIFGLTSVGMVPMTPSAHASQIVIFSPWSGTTELNVIGGDFVYRAVNSDLGDGAAAGKWMADQGYQAVATIAEVSESPLSAANAAREVLAAQGTTIVSSEDIVPGQASYAAEVNNVLGANPDVIYLGAALEAGISIIREAIEQGYDGDWILSADLVVDSLIDAVGPDANNVVYAEQSGADTSLASYGAFEAAHIAAFGVEPGVFGAQAYDSANLIALAMHSGGCSGVGINGAMRTVSSEGIKVSNYVEGAAILDDGGDIDYEGASGPLTFDGSGTVSASYEIIQVQNGAWVKVKFYPASEFEE